MMINDIETGVLAAQVEPTDGAARPVGDARASESPWRVLARRFFKSRIGTAAALLLAIMVVAAVASPLIAPQDPYDLTKVSILEAERSPGTLSTDHTMRYVLGTDGAGRDMLSAILYGLRISLGIGVASALVALVLGTSLGLISAYFGGKVDALLMRIVDVQLSVPTILVALVLLAVLGQGVDKTLMALVLVQWAIFARNVRGAALVERSKDYIEAALGQGLPARRIMFRHVLPNCVAPLIVTTTNQMANAITLEATMSFLGIGLPQTKPSLGLLISNGFDYMLSNQYWISVFPGVALVLLVMAVSLVGDQLRLVLNPKLDV
ncbi:peptide ABC transporter permease [Herbaspirillum rubrisubalbicans]|jgi:peptide/nickel transport system permease protein|uniref:Peptide ABC transporter permease n=2 Tax=Herbaspirillum rubrisubalbicans TaxID=80842 RepID=A0ABX9C7T3_9BURK|nr:ABC transporter permease [Herbaspirillum rubrisubalbicans]MCP1572669.1 peptide/nickel transport system permease protein [Herbaspirillum rubrisubalbicans]QJQ01258.1 ABC transporter permease [Herbaspirillum rubrisubalbicans Os34]RAM67004.1 peptide ABC transporter permease [Herbaspirillum rubrisubalbicans]RAN49130.1 peptide ABC transporter permease [Herbaspirillum rubrisubalbicans]